MGVFQLVMASRVEALTDLAAQVAGGFYGGWCREARLWGWWQGRRSWGGNGRRGRGAGDCRSGWAGGASWRAAQQLAVGAAGAEGAAVVGERGAALLFEALDLALEGGGGEPYQGEVGGVADGAAGAADEGRREADGEALVLGDNYSCAVATITPVQLKRRVKWLTPQPPDERGRRQFGHERRTGEKTHGRAGATRQDWIGCAACGDTNARSLIVISRLVGSLSSHARKGR